MPDRAPLWNCQICVVWGASTPCSVECPCNSAEWVQQSPKPDPCVCQRIWIQSIWGNSLSKPYFILKGLIESNILKNLKYKNRSEQTGSPYCFHLQFRYLEIVGREVILFLKGSSDYFTVALRQPKMWIENTEGSVIEENRAAGLSAQTGLGIKVINIWRPLPFTILCVPGLAEQRQLVH